MAVVRVQVAVLLAGLAGSGFSVGELIAQRPLQLRVGEALDRARPELERHAKTARLGRLALVCLAMAHDGFGLDDPVFADAIERLAKSKLRQSYDISLRLMVMAQVREFPRRRTLAKQDVEELLRHQSKGRFTYLRVRGAHWDLSNTQYAALGLRAATALGVKVPYKHWLSLAKALLTMRSYRSGFSYRPDRSRQATPSMTVAGIAVLQVCYQQLNRSGRTRKRIEAAVNGAWQYLARNRGSIGKGRVGMRAAYYHYGLERAAILSDRAMVGDVDWYRAGAEWFLAAQHSGGGWGQQAFLRGLPRGTQPAGDVINTSFAVLFLRRRFQKTLSGPITPSGVLTRALPAQASEALVAATVAREIARGYRAVPDLILAMRSPILVRRKVVAKALPRITGRFLAYSPYRSLEQSEAVIRAAEIWWMREGRKQR